MTTELRELWIENILVPNDLFHLRPGDRASSNQIGAMLWIAQGVTPSIAHLQAFQAATSSIAQSFSNYALWLLATHTAWQPDSRVSRHRRLWGSLRSRGLIIPPGRALAESITKSEKGIRFSAALRFSSGSIESVASILEAEPASQIVALGPENEGPLASLVENGWERAPFGPPTVILDMICNTNGIILWPVGAFDDQEAGCVAIGRTEVVATLTQ